MNDDELKTTNDTSPADEPTGDESLTAEDVNDGIIDKVATRVAEIMATKNG